ncbi:oligosaccharide flippase family protein [Hathewaya histolytica]|uniref:oligosaccharide flippase family protein n=1 Tax=Hathewaya histolytica TaxID=1498 RepID=UPI003B67FDB8
MYDSPNSLIKRFIGFSVGPVISAFISFFIVPLTTYFVVPTEFGKASMYNMALSISSLFVFLGMDQSFTREFNREENKKNLFWNSFIVPFVFSFILAFIYIVFYKSISILMFKNIERYTMIILSMSLPFMVIDRFNLLLIRMQEKARIYSVLNVISKIINVIILVPYLMYIDNSFKGIINAGFIGLILMCAIELIFTKDFWLNKFYINKKLMVDMFSYGLPLIPTSIIVWFLSSMDKIAMRQWSDFNQIGLYSAALKIVAVVTIIQQAFCNFWTPTAYRWYEEKVENNQYIKVSNMLLCIMNFIFIFIVLFRDLIIKILSPRYSAASPIVPFLLFLPIMYTVSEATSLGISLSRKTSYNILTSLIAALINYILNYLLVPKYGALGAAIATAVSYIVFFWARTLISRKLWFKFSLKYYFFNILFMIVLVFVDVFYHNIYLNVLISLIILFIDREQINQILKYVKIFVKNKKQNI